MRVASIVSLCLIVVVLIACGGNSPPAANPVTIRQTIEQTQAERDAEIANLVKVGILAGVDYSGQWQYPTLIFGPQFPNLSKEAQEGACKLVFARAFAIPKGEGSMEDTRFILIRDTGKGRNIGTYSPAQGIKVLR